MYLKYTTIIAYRTDTSRSQLDIYN